MAKKPPEPQRRLNPEQQRVVDHLHGPLRVGAVAGSGKSHALIERAAMLVEKHHVTPGKILLISFSVNARKVMEKRLTERLPGVSAGEICRTFHSIGLDIFREEQDQAKAWLLDTTSRLWRKSIRQAAQRHGLSLAAKGSDLNMKMVEKIASLAKTQMLISNETLRRLGRIEPGLLRIAQDVAGHWADDALSIMHAAEEIREVTGIEEEGMFQRFLTFDDMLHQTAMLLRDRGTRARWAHRWTFVMQDECQDESPVQAEIAEALCSEHQNYMVVGDSAQAIFGFRGARPERMLAFTTTWPAATTIVMDRNYRSGIEVIDVANRVIQNMPESTIIAKAMKCERQSRAYVACHAFDDEVAEADAIARNINRHFDQGLAWKDQAIIVRMNAMARAIEVALATAKIPYRIVSGESFFKMTEASILLGYLRVASKRASLSDVEHSISNPSRMVGKVYFEQLSKLRESKPDVDWRELALMPQLNRRQAENMESWQAVIDELRADTHVAMTPHQILTWLLKTLDLAAWLKSDSDGDNEPVQNITQILAFAANYGTVQEMLDTVDAIDKHKKSSARMRNVVEVSTIHRYKGREALVIYMPGLVHGAFPLSKGDFLEERRLFYVGVTRAMDELWISYPQFGAEDTKNEPSTFLDESGIKTTNEFEPGRKIQATKVGAQMGLLI